MKEALPGSFNRILVLVAYLNNQANTTSLAVQRLLLGTICDSVREWCVSVSVCHLRDRNSERKHLLLAVQRAKIR